MQGVSEAPSLPVGPAVHHSVFPAEASALREQREPSHRTVPPPHRWWWFDATGFGVVYYAGWAARESPGVGIRGVWSWSAWKKRKMRQRIVSYQLSSKVVILPNTEAIAKFLPVSGCNLPSSTRWRQCTDCCLGRFPKAPPRAHGAPVPGAAGLWTTPPQPGSPAPTPQRAEP